MKRKSLHDLCIKDNRILQSSEPATLEEGKKILELLDSLMTSEGVGLAAPQIGIFKRVCTLDIKDPESGGPLHLHFINPEIISESGVLVEHQEKCFSVSKKSEYLIYRHQNVVVKDDLNGEIELSGFPAFVIQHEIDHLDGKTIKTEGRPVMPMPIRKTTKVGRNDPCVCGSKKKFKKCCAN